MFNRIFVDDVGGTLHLLRRSMGDFFGGTAAASALDGSEWTSVPAFEAGWSEDKLNLRVVLPGVSEKDVKVTVQGNQLQVEGDRKAPEKFSTNGGFSYLPYGKFFRAIDLPTRLDFEKVSCQLHDGVLDIEIPVKAEMKPRVIPISAGESNTALAA